MIEALFDEYYNSLVTVDKTRAFASIDNALKKGVEVETIVFKVVVPGIEKMLEAFLEKKEISLSRHFFATTIADELLEKLLPMFSSPVKLLGKVIIGCAAGDFHGLGKKIVAGCMRARMIEVIDLGLNVPAERFVEEAVKHNAQVIGVSSMMAHTALGEGGARKVRELLVAGNLENKIKLIVGGAPYCFDPDMYKEVKADAWGENGMVAADVVSKLLKEVQK
ncbi:MAG: cobalamin-binding protein [bacterium]|nr:cobalamin-binding protein [bacterium]